MLVLWQGWLDRAPPIRAAARVGLAGARGDVPDASLPSAQLKRGGRARHRHPSSARVCWPVASFAGFRQLCTVEDAGQLATLPAGRGHTRGAGRRWTRSRVRELRPGAFELRTGSSSRRSRRWRWYLAVPDGGAGAGSIAFRLDLVPWLVVLVWLATRPSALGARVGGRAAPAGELALLATNAIAIAELQPELEAMHEADALLTAGWTVLPLMEDGQADPDPTQARATSKQSVSSIAAPRRRGPRIVMLNNWNAHYRVFPAVPAPRRTLTDLLGNRVCSSQGFAGSSERLDSRSTRSSYGGLVRLSCRQSPSLQTELDSPFCPAAMPATAGTLFVRRRPDGERGP